MTLWTARSTFKETNLDRKGQCTACRRTHPAGAKVLLKTYRNRINHRQTVRVILCGEECWQEYDFNHWEAESYKKRLDAKYERLERIEAQALAEGYGDSAGIVRDRIEGDLEYLEEMEEKEMMRNFEI